MLKSEPKEFWEDLNWGMENYSKLVRKYPDKWVAIVNKRVVASGDSIKRIEIEAEKKSGRKKEKIPVIFIECGANVY